LITQAVAVIQHRAQRARIGLEFIRLRQHEPVLVRRIALAVGRQRLRHALPVAHDHGCNPAAEVAGDGAALPQQCILRVAEFTGAQPASGTAPARTADRPLRSSPSARRFRGIKALAEVVARPKVIEQGAPGRVQRCVRLGDRARVAVTPSSRIRGTQLPPQRRLPASGGCSSSRESTAPAR
jgi:hypothetical protein